MEPVLLPKEAPRVARPERPRADTGHTFLAKPPARAALEPASSPGKGSEPRPLAPPGSSHAAIARAPAKSLAPHHASPDQPAPPAPPADLHREKTQSKPFSIQELELRSLGKTTLTAATFIDAIIMRQIAHDKGPREGGALAADSPRDGKPSALRPPPVSWPKDISRSLLLIFPPFFVGFGILFLNPSSSIARSDDSSSCCSLVRGHPIICTSFYHDFFFWSFAFFPLMNGSVILTSIAPPISPCAPSSGERGASSGGCPLPAAAMGG